ncbi:MAG: signal peptide peptidase SppA [Planctomycetota bacterium]
MRVARYVAVSMLLVAVVALLVGAAAPATKKAPEKPATEAAPKPAQRTVKVVEVPLRGVIQERAAVAMPFGPQPKLLRDFTGSIRKAADDESIEAIVLRIREPVMGLAKRQELMDAIAEFKAKDKEVYAYLDACGNGSYLLACSADHIAAAPAGMILLTGLHMEASFLKGLLDWAGIQAEFVASGPQKSAAHALTRESMTEENRKVLNEYLDDVYDQFVRAIATGRELTPEEVRARVDNGPYAPDAAAEARLVDQVAYYDEFLDRVGRDLDGEVEVVENYHRLGKKGPDLSQMDLFTFFSALQPKPAIPATRHPKVVIVYASGIIAPQEASLFGAETVNAKTMHEAFEKARSDETVKAVVLRIDSRGGSALISDMIWREIQRTKAAGKPVIASMSDVAGSGGYYIAMPCDAIVAQPATVTGSIGVVGGKLSLAGLYEKIHVNVETFSRGKNAGIFTDARGFTDSQRERFAALLGHIYDEFVEKAAEGRNMEEAKMRQLATGRIWTGRAALEEGLVDRLGGLRDAYHLAVEKAGLKPEDVQPVILPRERSVLEMLFNPAAASRMGADPSTLPEALRRKMPLAQIVKLLEHDNMLAIMPFLIEMK